jgi:hypothetical protein
VSEIAKGAAAIVRIAHKSITVFFLATENLAMLARGPCAGGVFISIDYTIPPRVYTHFTVKRRPL